MTKSLITVTDQAKEYINQRIAGTNMLLGVRVTNKGCSGHTYEYQLVDPSKIAPHDETMTWPGGGITISALSVMYLLGSTLDIRTNMFESILVWNNPQAFNHCGCGESFSVKP